jgi:hypothetical protein
MLFLKLAKTGDVLLSGDLYHYPEERTLNRVPTFDFNQDQTRASRVAVDAFLKKTGAQLWIQHDFVGNTKLKKSPAYYDYSSSSTHPAANCCLIVSCYAIPTARSNTR